jgi:hypothetical protein
MIMYRAREPHTSLAWADDKWGEGRGEAQWKVDYPFCDLGTVAVCKKTEIVETDVGFTQPHKLPH